MAAILVGFKMVGLPDFRSYLKSEPFANPPFLDDSKSGCIYISDSHCTYNTEETSLNFNSQVLFLDDYSTKHIITLK